MEYGFNTELAKSLGLNEAIMIRHFQYWINHNKANGKNYYEGRYWTYNTIAAFSEIFPFWTKDQIRYTLKKLTDKDILYSGNFNKNPYDKTLWYSINEEKIASLLKSDNEILPDADSKTPSSNWEISVIDVGNFPHRCGKIPTPIPHIEPCIKPCNNTHEQKCVSEIFSVEAGVDEFCADYKAVKGCDDLTNKEREEILKVLKKENGYDKKFWCAVFQKSLGGWEINEGGKVRKVPCGLQTILKSYGEIYRNEKGLKKVSLRKKEPPEPEMSHEPEIFDAEAAEKERQRARVVFEQIKREGIGFG